jgi:hypothetical protein
MVDERFFAYFQAYALYLLVQKSPSHAACYCNAYISPQRYEALKAVAMPDVETAFRRGRETGEVTLFRLVPEASNRSIPLINECLRIAQGTERRQQLEAARAALPHLCPATTDRFAEIAAARFLIDPLLQLIRTPPLVAFLSEAMKERIVSTLLNGDEVEAALSLAPPVSSAQWLRLFQSLAGERQTPAADALLALPQAAALAPHEIYYLGLALERKPGLFLALLSHPSLLVSRCTDTQWRAWLDRAACPRHANTLFRALLLTSQIPFPLLAGHASQLLDALRTPTGADPHGRIAALLLTEYARAPVGNRLSPRYWQAVTQTLTQCIRRDPSHPELLKELLRGNLPRWDQGGQIPALLSQLPPFLLPLLTHSPCFEGLPPLDTIAAASYFSAIAPEEWKEEYASALRQLVAPASRLPPSAAKRVVDAFWMRNRLSRLTPLLSAPPIRSAFLTLSPSELAQIAPRSLNREIADLLIEERQHTALALPALCHALLSASPSHFTLGTLQPLIPTLAAHLEGYGALIGRALTSPGKAPVALALLKEAPPLPPLIVGDCLVRALRAGYTSVVRFLTASSPSLAQCPPSSLIDALYAGIQREGALDKLIPIRQALVALLPDDQRPLIASEIATRFIDCIRLNRLRPAEALLTLFQDVGWVDWERACTRALVHLPHLTPYARRRLTLWRHQQAANRPSPLPPAKKRRL